MTWPEAAGPMLADHRIGRLATVDDDHQPYCIPVCFFWDGTHIFIALDDKPKGVPWRRLRRVRNIEADPRVSFLLDTYSEDWSRLAFLMVQGQARVADAADHAVEGLRQRYPQYRTMAIDTHPMIHIEPHHATYWHS